MQHWQAKIDFEQAKEDHKIMEKDLSTLSGHQLQYYLQRQAEVMKRLAKRGGPAWCRTQITVTQSKIISSEKDDDDKPGGSGMDESDDEEDI
ncbi:hypothetical protein GIB67_034349 [Kingdonia uniflora]|uniref:No apical meristem-associated C-terminal domain-containing protein n=1 Tax=Kingdonia uniflora TaxID=39325 RepID=A0A7J7NRW6_9MAGN|nr:hypothetical protein GIB67_034349 [Kingdonia uniflora]